MTRASLIRRLGVFIGMLCLVVPFSGGTASATSAYYTTSSLPFYASPNICMGGQLCGLSDNITVDFSQFLYIDSVQVYAHDNIGDKHGAHLVLYINGIKVGEQDVLAAGGWIYFNHSQYDTRWSGNHVVLRSVQASGDSGGDETFVRDFQILGYLG
jgi:hypothetical protein